MMELDRSPSKRPRFENHDENGSNIVHVEEESKSEEAEEEDMVYTCAGNDDEKVNKGDSQINHDNNEDDEVEDEIRELTEMNQQLELQVQDLEQEVSSKGQNLRDLKRSNLQV